jgi:hypothetical protein
VYLVNKKTAQTKLAGYLSEQATYLSKKGNTLAGWLEKVENRGNSVPPTSNIPTPKQQPTPQGKVVKKWSDLK